MDSSNAEKATDRELWDIAQSVYEPGSRSAYAPFDHPDLIDGHRAVYDAGRDDANASRDAEVAALREQLAAAGAVIEAIRAEWNRGLETDLLDWEGLTPILATAPSVVLEDRDREVAARALLDAAAVIPEEMRVDELAMNGVSYTWLLPKMPRVMLNGGVRFAERLVQRAAAIRKGDTND